jgi:hypothetical protein
MEDEGVGENAIRGVFPFFALAPPVLFYATRIWPEVPAALLRGGHGVREQREAVDAGLLGLLLVEVCARAIGVVAARKKLALAILAVLLIVAAHHRRPHQRPHLARADSDESDEPPHGFWVWVDGERAAVWRRLSLRDRHRELKTTPRSFRGLASLLQSST